MCITSWLHSTQQTREYRDVNYTPVLGLTIQSGQVSREMHVNKYVSVQANLKNHRFLNQSISENCSPLSRKLSLSHPALG